MRSHQPVTGIDTHLEAVVSSLQISNKLLVVKHNLLLETELRENDN